MLKMNVKAINKYDFCNEKFQIAYDFLQREDLASLEEGRMELGLGVYCMVSHYTTLPACERKFEAHDKYFDIQCIIEGQENIVLAKRSMLKEAVSYDKEKDVVFFEEPISCGSIGLYDGDFLIVTPEDAHKPHCDLDGSHAVKKIVFKIPV